MRLYILIIIILLSSITFAKTVTFNFEFNNTQNLTINLTNINNSFITEETQADFDDGIFTNTTSDIHGNGSVRLTEDAVLIMNFDVNGTLSGKVTDISNNENDGTLVNGPFWNQSNGKYGSAYKFNGINQDIYVLNATVLNFNSTKSITVSAWINPVDALTTCASDDFGSTGYYCPIVAKNDLSLQKGWEIADSSEALRVTLRNGGTDNDVSGGTILNNIWTHVAFTYNGTLLTLYVNGISVATSNYEGGWGDSSDVLKIGSRERLSATSNDNKFNGMIDDVRIYNRSLSAAEILALNNSVFSQAGKYYTNGIYLSSTLIAESNVTWKNVTARIAFNGSSNPVDTTALILWYKFNETTGSRVFDGSPSGNNATLNVSGFISEKSFSDNALSFTLPNSCVVSDTNLAISGQFTASAWVNRKNYPIGTLVNEVVSNRIGSASNWWRLVVTDNSPTFTIFDGSSHEVVASTPIKNNTWNYITGVYNSTHLLIYLNGILDNNLSNTIDPTITTAPIFVGCRADPAPGVSFGGTFNGTIDEVQIFNRSLSSTEIFENYRRGIAKQGGNITLQISTSADNITWTSLSSEVVLQDNVTINLPDVASGQYLNYTLNFKTNDTSATSYLFNISFETNITTQNSSSIQNNLVIRVNNSLYNSTSMSGTNIFNPENKFISFENSTSVFGFVYAGEKFIDIRIINTSDLTKMFQIRQSDSNNRIIMSFTKSGWDNIESKMPIINEFRIIPKTFGNYIINNPGNFDLFIISEYLSQNFNSYRISSGQNKLQISNTGKSENRGSLNIRVI